METDNGRINFKLQNKNPKKNPVSYQIETMQDIANCVTIDNIDGFMIDFEASVRSFLLFKSIKDDLVSKGELPPGSEIQFPSFEWIDDWKPKRKRNK